MKRTIQGTDIEIKTEQRDGYFASRTKPFAITAYGKTKGESQEQALLGIELYLKYNPIKEGYV